MNTFFIKKTNKNDYNIFKRLFCGLFVLFDISLLIIIFEHNYNELCLNPLPKCENSIIKYADQTKDHLLPATLDDIYLPIPEEKTIDGTTKVIITDHKKLYMPMYNDILYDSICDKFFDGEDFICNILGKKKSYEYQVSSDRKQADLYYNYGTRTESTHIDISDRYNKLSIEEHKKIIEEHLNEIARIKSNNAN